MDTHHILLFFFSAIISIGYLNFCNSNNDFEQSAPRIWPNISENSSFEQWPGLTGSGGLDFSFYDAFESAVNFSRGVPYLVVSKSNFTWMQVALMGAVGAIACGAASLLAQAAFYREQDKQNGHLKRRKDVNVPTRILNSVESYELPSVRSPNFDYRKTSKQKHSTRTKPIHVSKFYNRLPPVQLTRDGTKQTLLSRPLGKTKGNLRKGPMGSDMTEASIRRKGSPKLTKFKTKPKQN